MSLFNLKKNKKTESKTAENVKVENVKAENVKAADAVEPAKTDYTYLICEMWDTKLMFCGGWYFNVNSEGEASPISYKRALGSEVGYYDYQASQDVERAGADPETAYPNRGFGKNKETGEWEFLNPKTDLHRATAIKIENELVIPERIGGYPVTHLDGGAFASCKKLTKVTFPKSLKKIGNGAFANCSGLTEVTFPKSLKEIGNGAFRNCTELHTVQMDRDDVSIGSDAFTGTKVSMGNIPGIQVFGTVLIRADKNLTGCFTVPENIRRIAPLAFKDCAQLKKVILPEKLTEIGASAFSGCTALEEVVMPKSLDLLDNWAFSGCKSLKAIEIPEGVRKLGVNVFRNCKELRSVKLPETLEEIGHSSFAYIGMWEDFMHGGTEPTWYIDKWLIAWRPHPGTLTVRPGTVGIAGGDFIEQPKVGAVVFPDSLRFIGSYAFDKSPLTEVILPPKLKKIGGGAFSGTNIRSVVIPEGVEKLTQWSFLRCSQLEQIKLLGNTEIEFGAFSERRDGKEFVIIADSESAKEFCEKYGERDNLVLKSL